MYKIDETIAERIMGGLLSKQVTKQELVDAISTSLATVAVVRKDGVTTIYIEALPIFAFASAGMNHPDDFTVETRRD